MYYFPRRPTISRSFQARRTWNAAFPGYENVLCHYIAGEGCWADTAMTSPSLPGEHIAAVSDLTDYGRHMVQVATASHILTVDSGFPAIYSNTSGNAQGAQLRTALAFACPYQIAVIRSPSSSWSYYGAALGALEHYDHKAYSFSGQTFAYWPGYQYPTGARKNGVEMLGSTMNPITAPFVIGIEVNEPGNVRCWELGSTTHTNDYSNTQFSYMFLYEVIGFSNRPDPDTLTEIETYLMDKYGIG